MGDVVQFSSAVPLSAEKHRPPPVGYCSLQRAALDAAAAAERGVPLLAAPIIRYLRLLADPASTPGPVAREATLSIELIAGRLTRAPNMGTEWDSTLTAAAQALRERWDAFRLAE